MKNENLNRVFVIPAGSSLASTGTTATLTPNQFGVFLPNYTPGAAGTTAAADYIFCAQGRPDDSLNLRSVKSDWIKGVNVVEKYILTGSATTQQQVIQVSNFTAQAGNQYAIVIRAWSEGFRTWGNGNGAIRIFTVNGPCIECGDDPCAPLTADQTEDLVDAFVAKINADNILKGGIVASRTGTGTSSVLVLTAQAIPVPPQNGDLNANPFLDDFITFEAYAQVDPSFSQDLWVPDNCVTFATVTTTQEAVRPKGTADQVRQREKEWYAYTIPSFKTRYSNPNYNGLYHSNVVAGTIYNEIKIVCKDYKSGSEFMPHDVLSTFTVTIFVPQALSAALVAILTPQIGTLVEKA